MVRVLVLQELFQMEIIVSSYLIIKTVIGWTFTLEKLNTSGMEQEEKIINIPMVSGLILFILVKEILMEIMMGIQKYIKMVSLLGKKIIGIVITIGNLEIIIFLAHGRNSNNWFQGAIDDVRIYDKFLSESEVKALHEIESQVSQPNSILIEAGQLSGDIYVFAEDDNIFGENSERLTVSLDNIVNAKIGTSASAVVTITDNDIVPTATVSSVKGFEIQEGSSSFLQLKASLDSVTTRDVIIKLKGSGDASNDDYTVSTISSDTSSFRPLQMVLGQIQGQNESHLSGVWTLVEENDNSYHQWIYEPNRSDYVNSSFRMSATSGDNQYPGNSDLWKWSDAGGDNGATLSCMMDDSFTFGENGTFRIELGSKTNIWTTQAESCDTN